MNNMLVIDELYSERFSFPIIKKSGCVGYRSVFQNVLVKNEGDIG